MQCSECGYMLDPFDKACPRCERRKSQPLAFQSIQSPSASAPRKGEGIAAAVLVSLLGVGIGYSYLSSRSTSPPPALPLSSSPASAQASLQPTPRPAQNSAASRNLSPPLNLHPSSYTPPQPSPRFYPNAAPPPAQAQQSDNSAELARQREQEQARQQAQAEQQEAIRQAERERAQREQQRAQVDQLAVSVIEYNDALLKIWRIRKANVDAAESGLAAAEAMSRPGNYSATVNYSGVPRQTSEAIVNRILVLRSQIQASPLYYDNFEEYGVPISSWPNDSLCNYRPIRRKPPM